jgi:hypothetical protein
MLQKMEKGHYPFINQGIPYHRVEFPALELISQAIETDGADQVVRRALF